MSKFIIFLIFIIYFGNIAYQNYKKINENCTEREQLLFCWTTCFSLAVIIVMEYFSLAFESLVELLGGA